MVDYKDILAISGSVLFAGSGIIYIVSILQGKTKPHVFSFGIWTILSTIGFLSQLYDNAGSGSWVTFIGASRSFIAFLLAFKYGVKDVTKGDKVALFFAFIAIILWIITKTPLYSIILVTIIDFCGYFPTLNKIRRLPDSEAIFPWFISVFAILFGILALDNYTILTVMYPAMIMLMNVLIVIFVLYFKRKLLPNH